MALKTFSQEPQARPGEPADRGGEQISTRFGAAPHPQAPIREPRYIHALMLAAWLGRLIDPVDLVHHTLRRN
jgi:hypothetical protein